MEGEEQAQAASGANCQMLARAEPTGGGTEAGIEVTSAESSGALIQEPETADPRVGALWLHCGSRTRAEGSFPSQI